MILQTVVGIALGTLVFPFAVYIIVYLTVMAFYRAKFRAKKELIAAETATT